MTDVKIAELRGLAESHKGRADDCGALARLVLYALAAQPAGQGAWAIQLRDGIIDLETIAPTEGEAWGASDWFKESGERNGHRAIRVQILPLPPVPSESVTRQGDEK